MYDLKPSIWVEFGALFEVVVKLADTTVSSLLKMCL